MNQWKNEAEAREQILALVAEYYKEFKKPEQEKPFEPGDRLGYAGRVYDEKEMACTLFKPSYISLEYVLARAGVTFQYSEDITCISYQTRTLEIDGKAYVFRKINPMLWANMAGIEQRDNIAIATPERAFLDMVYLSAGQCYFDNLRPLNKDLIRQILPVYNSPILIKRVEALINQKG